MDIREMKCEDCAEVYDLWLSCSGMDLNNPDGRRGCIYPAKKGGTVGFERMSEILFNRFRKWTES